jgi:hypothetical protein
MIMLVAETILTIILAMRQPVLLIREEIEATVMKVELKKLVCRRRAPTEPLRILGAEEYLATLLVDQIVTQGDIIPIGIMGRRLDLMVVELIHQRDLKITDSTNNRI